MSLKWAPALLVAALAAPVLAHPGSGIVVSSTGDVYFLDTGAGVWKVDAKGALTKVEAPRFHWMTLDAEGGLKNIQLPSGSSGEVTRVASVPGLMVASDFPLAVGKDGSLYYPRRAGSDRVDIVRLPASGPSSVLATLPVPYVNGMTAAPDGSLYVTEHRAIRKIDAQGKVTTVAASVAPPGCVSIPGNEPNDPLLRGLAVDASGTVYVAASGCGSVLKIAPDGKVTKVLQLESPWSPTAVALSGGDLYVEEYLHTPDEDRRQWLPRVRKIAADGKATVIATVSR